MGPAPLLGEETIRSLKAFKELRNSGAVGQWVDFEAQATLFNASYGMLILQNDGLGAYGFARLQPDHPVQSGDWVRIEGRAVRGSFMPIVNAERLTWLRPGVVPDPIELTDEVLRGHEVENLWGRVRVHVRQVRPRSMSEIDPVIELSLETPAGLRFIAIWFGGELKDAAELAGADVEITGVGGTAGNGNGQKINPLFLLGSRSQIRVIERKKVDWDVPAITVEQLAGYRSGTQLGDRVRIRGVVTYADNSDFFYFSDGTAGMAVWLGVPGGVKAEQSIEVTGVIAREGERFGLAEAEFRPTAPMHLKPYYLTAKQDPGFWFGGQVVELPLMYRLSEKRQERTMLFCDFGAYTVTVEWLELAPWTSAPEFTPGDLIIARGVAEFQESGTSAVHLRILVRSPADLSIQERAPLWRRMNWRLAAGVLAVVLIVGLIWFLVVRRQMELVMAERTRIARELHDTLAQCFTGIFMQLNASRKYAERNPEISLACVMRAESLAREGLRESRQAVMALAPETAEVSDLAEAIRGLLDVATADTATEAQLVAHGTQRPISTKVAANIVQVFREALGNAQRYAGASQIRVELNFLSDSLQLIIADNGVGFVLEEVAQSGFGLAGMQERAKRMGGTLSIESSPGAGTTIILTTPLASAVDVHL